MDKARDNILRLLQQVKFFASVPERVKQLTNLLNSDEMKLKEVFIESLKLESLRSAIMKELSISHHKRGSKFKTQSSTDANSNSNSAIPSRDSVILASSSKDEDMNHDRIRHSVENHLKIVPELSKQIYKRLFHNLERMTDIANEYPEYLVLTFEIIEMYAEYIQRKKSSPTGTLGIENLDMNITQSTLDHIQLKCLERIESNFVIMNESNLGEIGEGPVDSKVGNILNAATEILNDVLQFKSYVLPCIPPSYHVIDIYIQCYDQFFLPHLKFICTDLNSLEVADIMLCIQWFEYYKSQIVLLGINSHSTSQMYNDYIENLLHEYLLRIKSQIISWFQNIKNQPLEIVKDSAQHLITSQPEDMMNVLHMQLSVAKDKLPYEYIYHVLLACLNVLREVQRQSYDDLNLNWKVKGVESLCAMVNDNERMQEKCNELSDWIEKLISLQEQQEYLIMILEEVANEYISLAVTSANYVAKCVLADLDEPVFSKLFTDEWESGQPLMEIYIATLEDYFNDIRVWLPEFFYDKFVKDIFIQSIFIYVISISKHGIVITSNASSNNINFPHLFTSEMNAASRISNDYEVLRNFYQQHSETLSAGGLKSSFMDELEPLKQLAHITILSKMNGNGVEDNVKLLFKRYGKEGLAVVTSAICCNPAMNKNEKIHNIKLANELFKKKQGDYPILNDLFHGISSLAIDSGVDIEKLKSLALKPKSKLTDWIRRGRKKQANDDGDY